MKKIKPQSTFVDAPYCEIPFEHLHPVLIGITSAVWSSFIGTVTAGSYSNSSLIGVIPLS